jgi:hypothetical protein
MTAQQQQKILSIGQLLNQVSSVGAFIGAIVIIIQIGDYKGRTEATIEQHERRILRVEAISEKTERDFAVHESKEIQ